MFKQFDSHTVLQFDRRADILTPKPICSTSPLVTSSDSSWLKVMIGSSFMLYTMSLMWRPIKILLTYNRTDEYVQVFFFFKI